MKLLILGGTAWLGHHTALAAIAAGHNVTCAARGNSGNAPAGSRFLQTDRDSGNGLAAAAARSWDAVIDVSRQPGQVRRAVRDLAPSAAFYVFVSTGNVYASQQAPDQDEDAALLPPLEADVMESMEDYGPAKVACEAAVTAGFGPERRAIVRSGLIGGPGDVSGRSGYWPLRFAHPGGDGVLVPDSGERPTQLIDVRDLARWLCASPRRARRGSSTPREPPCRCGSIWRPLRASAVHPAAGSLPWCLPRKNGCAGRASMNGPAPVRCRCGWRIRSGRA